MFKKTILPATLILIILIFTFIAAKIVNAQNYLNNDFFTFWLSGNLTFKSRGIRSAGIVSLLIKFHFLQNKWSDLIASLFMPQHLLKKDFRHQSFTKENSRPQGYNACAKRTPTVFKHDLSQILRIFAAVCFFRQPFSYSFFF